MPEIRVRPKSWKYRSSVSWMEARKGRLSCEGRPELEVATPAEFGGHEGIWTPEDLFVASVNVCLMTTFLHFQGRIGFELVSYESEAEGTLESGDGGLRFTRVTVRPRVTVASEADREKAQEALRRGEQNCLISRSISAAVAVEPEVQSAAEV